MQDNDAIVNPVKGKNPPDTGRVAIMAATQADINLLNQINAPFAVGRQNLYMSRVALFENSKGRFSLAGPFMGAPYAAMVVEALAMWGVEQIVFLGWCGAVSEKVKTGDIILADRAFIDEGTSAGYTSGNKDYSSSSKALMEKVKQIFKAGQAPCLTGPLWSTDAVFRETKKKVTGYQKKGALAVEMEVSSIYTVARFRKIDAVAITVVSDELSSLKWKPGFKTPEFKNSRKIACKMANQTIQALL